MLLYAYTQLGLWLIGKYFLQGGFLEPMTTIESVEQQKDILSLIGQGIHPDRIAATIRVFSLENARILKNYGATFPPLFERFSPHVAKTFLDEDFEICRRLRDRNNLNQEELEYPLLCLLHFMYNSPSEGMDYLQNLFFHCDHFSEDEIEKILGKLITTHFLTKKKKKFLKNLVRRAKINIL